MAVFDVDKFLDRAKVAAGVESDYALAVKVLGYSQQSTVTNWRSGRSVPDERAIVKLCELTGDDMVRVAVELQARRASNDDAAALWRMVAKRLSAAKIALACAIVFAAMTLGGQDALADPLPLAAGSMLQSSYLLALCLAVAFSRRLLASLPRLFRACAPLTAR